MIPTGTVPADLDEYAAAMLRAADRVALAYRSEDPDTIAAVIEEAVTIPAPPGTPDPWQALVGALAVQVDVDRPWRHRFAWTLDVAAVAAPVPDPGPSSGSYLSASACLDGDTWGAAPSSSTLRRSA